MRVKQCDSLLTGVQLLLTLCKLKLITWKRHRLHLEVQKHFHPSGKIICKIVLIVLHKLVFYQAEKYSTTFRSKLDYVHKVSEFTKLKLVLYQTPDKIH